MLQGLRRSLLIREGSVAIEFAILSFPYFMIVFSILEMFISFTAGQLFESAAYDIARKIRIGELNKKKVSSLVDFRRIFCQEIGVLFRCSEGEIRTPYDFYVDVHKINSLQFLINKIPRKNGNDYSSEIDDRGFDFDPGGPKTYNVLRAYYHWPLFTDFLHRYITAVKHPGKGTDFLITSIVVFKNEPF
ncbi:hypothetical protein G293_03525 [Candidatus Liberibacter africanus PTSAPSY]|uniref:TadE-like domain-containing protein n=1 Tax=Candidatus Liberibacter africanus PTSAPSY TaxID=1277257 RepID=A0A0G3I720_LIBAF|nr:hypothetical protein G293_03525 [Candidatus Liberibacter africanus PTSAPSY]